ncbi:DUF397 domain-containing protein [Streptomyces sp. NBC_01352]
MKLLSHKINDSWFPGVAPVRDRKVPHGPAVTFTAGSWASVTGKLRSEWRPSPIPQPAQLSAPPLHLPEPSPVPST